MTKKLVFAKQTANLIDGENKPNVDICSNRNKKLWEILEMYFYDTIKFAGIFVGWFFFVHFIVWLPARKPADVN